eukprot:NODE_13468_length_1164_cov_3.783992.p6 GENE.NODE_13468_length_1164_cov_3.783992~~NODE_13468_length_1164_cov_3.783992.p6  ORF type:complete len:65 (+),score=10.64 NODE_13468_length_1164_cov_3.783992:90-284(+)
METGIGGLAVLQKAALEHYPHVMWRGQPMPCGAVMRLRADGVASEKARHDGPLASANMPSPVCT